MKRVVIIICIALAVGYFGLLPFESTDAGELYVVETLVVDRSEESICFCSGDLTGCGATAAEAVADMERKTPGQLFLRQTKRLIFCGGAEESCDPMTLPEELPMGAGVYASSEPAEMLLEEQDVLEEVLEAWERRNEQMPTLAEMKDSALKNQKPKLVPLRLEETDEQT